ncbi:TetR/AcrR family transcriptional regulator [Mycobacterium helveticum]|uniref:TetR/AcrR family transcriptional regulator n=1 Tax=Mycobacterium helveticum TaxID=2592811 RepID=A0A557XJ06_9MYCO|nr:TetR/AcrR family transcriptional regulator [Mycobacterium helveticum]TVS84038.1 TetR/AcrR family transcriptional regulator [Mycobacterium helveticum]TVS85660.1 TetR/AcrR family transcriptional regulator [Mycobacterium helveticum]
MTSPRLGRPVGASGEQTRRRIIAATMRCVAEVGYSRATIRQIARTAEMTSASLYNYFPNKSELIEAAVAERTDVALPRLRAAAAGAGDVVDRIEAVLEESGRLMREYPDLAAFEWAIRAAGDTGFHALRAIVETVVEEGHRRGELAGRVDPRGAVEAVYSLVYGLTELAATLPPEEYHAALASARRMVRGTLLGGAPLM